MVWCVENIYYEEIIFRMYILRIAPLNFTLIGY
jgi:hypothetical protein